MLKSEENTVKQLVTDEELDKAFGHLTYGSLSKREVVKLGVLKCAGGWYQGHSSRLVLEELGLINDDYTLTVKGKKYLWESWTSDKEEYNTF